MRNSLEHPFFIQIMGNWWNIKSDNLGEVWVKQILQDLPIEQILLHLHMLWDIDGKTHAFLTRYRIPGWEYDRRKLTLLWKKYRYLFRKSHSNGGFCCSFSCYKKVIGKAMYFLCDKVYFRMKAKGRKHP